MYVWKSNLMPKRFDAIALKWVVIMRDPTDEALLAHEMEHIKVQRRIGLIKYLWRYFTNSRFRALQEVGAYRVQGASDASIEHILHTRYNISLLEARDIIKCT